MRSLLFRSQDRGWGLYFRDASGSPAVQCAAAVCYGRIKLLFSRSGPCPLQGRGGVVQTLGESEATTGRSLPCPWAEPGCLLPDLPLPARPNIIPLPGGDFNASYTSEAIKKTVGIQ